MLGGLSARLQEGSLPELAVLNSAGARLHGNDAQLDGAPGGPGSSGRALNDCYQPLTKSLVAPGVIALRPVEAVRVPYGLTSLPATTCVNHLCPWT